MGMKRRKVWLVGLLAAAMMCAASCGTAGNDLSADRASEASAVSKTEEVDSDSGAEEAAEADASGQKATEEAGQTEKTEETEEELPVQEIDYEAEIRNHYAAKKEYEEVIRAMLLGNLESVKYIEMAEGAEDTNYRKMITDAIVEDGIESAVLSEGLKSVIDGVCEQKSIDEIMQETANGLMEDVQEEVRSTIDETLSSGLSGVKDLELFGAAAWVSEFLNVDDTPVALLNGMLELQRADVEAMTAILMQEEFYNGDLLYLSALYKRVCSRQNEIILAGGQTQKLEQEMTLDELIGKWNYENSMILALDALRENRGSEISSECKQDVFHFRDFTVQGLQACYDVAGYKAETKSVRQAGLLSDKLFGSLVGSMAESSGEASVGDIQQEKIDFYRQLENSLTAPYLEVCRAKSNFDILYGAEFQEITEAEDNRSAVGEDEIYEAANALVEAVSRYSFDLETAILFWENTLSDNETDFVGTLKYQLDQCYALLNEGLDIGILPGRYSVEEEYAKYVSLMDAYINYVNWSLIYSLHEPVYSGSSTVTAYGVGEFIVHYRGMDSNPFIFEERRLKAENPGERYLWIYNKEGNPVYIQDGRATVYVMDNLVIKANSLTGEDITEGDGALRLYNNAVRIRDDFLNGNLAHGYENYVF